MERHEDLLRMAEYLRSLAPRGFSCRTLSGFDTADDVRKIAKVVAPTLAEEDVAYLRSLAQQGFDPQGEGGAAVVDRLEQMATAIERASYHPAGVKQS